MISSQVAESLPRPREVIHPVRPDDPEAGRRRVVVIQHVAPEVDGGEFPVKRTRGERVRVEADVFADGHDQLAGVVKYRLASQPVWSEVPLRPLVNDRWMAEFVTAEEGRYFYTLEAWVDPFRSWREDLKKRVAAGQEVPVELQIGAALVREAAARAMGEDAQQLLAWAETLASDEPEEQLAAALDEPLAETVARYPDRRFSSVYPKELEVVADRPKARFSAWYEIFPRAASENPSRHGTLDDCRKMLGRIAEMGFDVLYLPPIHPIGRTRRKGPNAAPEAGPDDPGSPWAIGAAEGGHKAIHPELGTLEDFRRLVDEAARHGIEVALDLAYQCSPDHPYVREHPEWFRWRPDGTIQYAENPPKKYQDIYPLSFETDHWSELWEELKSVVLFWIQQGVRIFRVDNPHTKPLKFWQWLIEGIKAEFPDVLFLSEAFTRPKVMYFLAKCGFTQSYTYFAWRNTKRELAEYLTELTQTGVREYFRPNLWPNTPDILTEYLQLGGRPAFMIRLALAATLGASYGIYGRVFEHYVAEPRELGSEEYRDSEKYQLQHPGLKALDPLDGFIRRINRIRRENPALQSDWSLRFHPVENDNLLCYSKHCDEPQNTIVVAVNVDPYHTQSGWVELPLEELGIEGDRPFQVHDLLGDARYLWHGPRNYVELDPRVAPVQIFLIRRLVRTERQFEYFM